jgi:hypothetical protein
MAAIHRDLVADDTRRTRIATANAADKVAGRTPSEPWARPPTRSSSTPIRSPTAPI